PVGSRDLGFVEDHAAVDRIERAKRRPVQIDLGNDVRLCHRHVHGRGDADAGLEHAADHALDLVHRRDVGNAYRIGDAAGLHQLDVDDVGRAHADQLDDLGGTEHAFVGHDRRVHAFWDVFHAVQVLRLDRLFDQFETHAGVLEVLQGVYRLFGRPALVRVQTQQRAA